MACFLLHNFIRFEPTDPLEQLVDETGLKIHSLSPLSRYPNSKTSMKIWPIQCTRFGDLVLENDVNRGYEYMRNE
ncbi:hypothetical protein ACS0TY_020603 [Phlomoides rotata]